MVETWAWAAVVALLVLVGAKMLVTDLYKVPIWASLAVIALLVGTSIGTSLRTAEVRHRQPRARGEPG